MMSVILDNLVYLTIQEIQDNLKNAFILSILKANNRLLGMMILLISAPINLVQSFFQLPCMVLLLSYT